MPRKNRLQGSDERRLRLWLSMFFLALAIPTAALVWQAYSQLKWEAFHQYRSTAEELTRRINSDLVSATEKLEARSFAQYSFMVVNSTDFQQPSVLSGYPVAQDIQGLLGYFQVGAQGQFSTPLLPSNDTTAGAYRIPAEEYQQRRKLADELRSVLSNNQLVTHRGDTETAVSTAPAPERQAEYAPVMNDMAPAGAAPEQKISSSSRQPPSSQRAFDKLNKSRPSQYQGDAQNTDRDAATAQAQSAGERHFSLGKVADLKLDSAYQKKSEQRELAEQKAKRAATAQESASGLSRKQQLTPAEATASTVRDAHGSTSESDTARIRTFESDIEPLQFSLLDSGHFVLFRTAWRGGERFIQGMLLDQQAFINGVIEQPFEDTTLSTMAVMIVAYQGEVLSTVMGQQGRGYTSATGELQGELLYRSRLAAPFDTLEVIYTVSQLPPGPGARVVAWVSLVLALVLCIGFYSLYRMGLRQMHLARQQQDFVSAVSHELKTPLTSIRMYAEMLKEGWAAENKKQAYYQFIFEESERLSRLIANVLQLSNISRDQPQLEMKPVTVGEIIDSIQSKIETQAEGAGFELVIIRNPECESLTVNLDSDHFTQIIINLVDNAIKFSRKAHHKRLEISTCLRGDKQVIFSVRDFGPGIAKDQMRKIFDMFYRSESELTRETVGTGIGLAIVHQLSAAMGASVDVLNRNPGAEFQISVPHRRS